MSFGFTVTLAVLALLAHSVSALSSNGMYSNTPLNLAMETDCPRLDTPPFSATLEVADLCMG
jgi:hypothetical protein